MSIKWSVTPYLSHVNYHTSTRSFSRSLFLSFWVINRVIIDPTNTSHEINHENTSRGMWWWTHIQVYVIISRRLTWARSFFLPGLWLTRDARMESDNHPIDWHCNMIRDWGGDIKGTLDAGSGISYQWDSQVFTSPKTKNKKTQQDVQTRTYLESWQLSLWWSFCVSSDS